MANEVVVNGGKLWIKNEKGKRISKKYKIVSQSFTRVTKNFVEMVYLKKETIYATIHERVILNINTAEVVYEERFEHFNTYSAQKRFKRLVFDYVYLNPQNNTVYDTENLPLLDNIKEIDFKDVKLGNFLIIEHDPIKYSLIKNDKVLIQYADHMLLFGEDKSMCFYTNPDMAYVYNTDNMECVTQANLQEQACSIQLLNKFSDKKSIYIKYLEESEIRDLQDLTKVVKLAKFDTLPPKSACNYGDLTISCFDSHKAKEPIGYKMFDLDNFEFIFEEMFIEKFKLTDFNKKKYLVLRYPDKISIFTSKNHNLILSGKFTNISLSKYEDHFILEYGDLKGVATLDGQILLEPSTPYLWETPEGIYYLDAPIKEVKLQTN